MKELIFKASNEKTGENETVNAILNPELSDRNGYNVNFLGKKVPLPTVTNSILNEVAINQQPGKNGNLYLDYTNFSILFNQSKKLPMCTAVNISGKDNELAMVHEERKSDRWFKDERIKKNENYFQFGNSDYARSGFQKGHMVRFYDPAWGRGKTKRKIAMGDTFFYTNCCPQLGKYNAGIWNDLEDYYMARAVFQNQKISVFTGPIFNNALQYKTLLIPIHFWKIIVYRNEKSLEAMAFLISHEVALEKLQEFRMSQKDKNLVEPTLTKEDIDRLFTKKNLRKWMVKIALIEEKTNLKFNLNSIDINRDQELFYNVNLDSENLEILGKKGNEIIKSSLDDTALIMKI